MRRSSLLFSSDNRPTEAFAGFLRDMQIPGDDLPSIDVALQARFFQKNPDGQPLERWELKEVHVSCPPEKIREHLAECGFVNKTKPSQKLYDYAFWPGALALRVAERFFDLSLAWSPPCEWRETIVFGGKRSLNPDKESYEQCLLAFTGMRGEHAYFRPSWDEMKPQTELDMMRWGLNARCIMDRDLKLPNRWWFGSRVVFVDAPMKPPVKEGGSPQRPSTEDTIMEWLKSNPKPGTVLLSSGAPYGMAQDEAFWMLLEPHGFTVETFGHAAPDLGIEVFMREVAGCVNRIYRARA